MSTKDETVARVRHFSRFYTAWIGVLNEAMYDSDLKLGEARIVYEIAHRDETIASQLSGDLGLDPGYLSRIIKTLEQRGYVSRKPSTRDARRQILALTAKGRSQADTLNARSDEQVMRLLEPLGSTDRAALRGALATAERLLAGRPGTAPVCLFRDPKPGDISWVLHRQAVLYSREYGWDEHFENLVIRIGGEFIGSFDPERERIWIAEMGGKVVGSVFMSKASDSVAKLRMLYVEPDARGHGIGRRLVEECMSHARRTGYTRMTLWTNDVLTAARSIYEKAGFELVRKEAHEEFGKPMFGETWERDL
ncbi:MAG: MarR family transcriptional regulator [Rhodobiaceae bacterium]|nr:MarR family transcriptional regulator [Rhodobiaceae bacterium]